MLDETLLSRLQGLLDSQFAERDSRLPEEIAQADSVFIRSGMFQSGTRVLQVHRVYERELDIRAMLIWQSLVRVHGILGGKVESTTRCDIKQEVARRIQEQAEKLNEQCQQKVQKSRVSMNVNLVEACARTQRKHEIEIDLYVDSLQVKYAAASPAGNSTYHFYGPVGAVLPGANATAHVIQNLSTDERSAIQAALLQVKDALAATSELAQQQRTELSNIANECSVELNNGSPNGTKLLTMFNVLGLSIQSIASAQPAYQALKVALLSIGLTLP